MTDADLEALVAMAGRLSREIQALEEQIRPLQAELVTVNRKIAGVKLGRRSVSRRRQAVIDRDRLICEEARKLVARGAAYIPIFWQQSIADKYGLSGRQIRRILKVADIKVSYFT